MIGGGDGALEDVERLICCLETTVQASSADTFINDLLTYPFGDNFNCPVKSSTKYKICSLRQRGWESNDGKTQSAKGEEDALGTIFLFSSLSGILPPLFFIQRNLSFL